MVDINKIKKDLEKIEKKQDKINYLQDILKRIEDKKLKIKILELIEDLLDEESLDEVIEPMRARHDTIQQINQIPEIKRESHIINIPQEIIRGVVPRTNDNEDNNEEIKYSSASTEYDRAVKEPMLNANASFAERDPTKYARVEDIGERRYDARTQNHESEGRYIRPPTIDDQEFKNINEFSIESIISNKDKRHLKKTMEDRKNQRW